MHTKELSQFKIGFALHGYDNDIMMWLESTIRIFEGVAKSSVLNVVQMIKVKITATIGMV